jgi:type VI secretion system protein ImpB
MATVHQKLEKTRKPRVHITYETEINDTTENTELPFVTGVLGDFSGNNSSAEKKILKKRKFIEVSANNISDVMKKIAPGIKTRVKNTMAEGDKEMNVELNFKSMEDFEPANIAEQVPPLKKLLETRTKLEEILSKADRSEDLEQILENILQNTEQLKAVSSELSKGEESKSGDESATEGKESGEVK